ncbi:MAG: outer membrane beta-barrel protein [Ferruginibacter sp.]
MKIIFSSLLLLSVVSSKAQQSMQSGNMPMVTRSIGASFQKFEGLNSRVAESPQFDQLKSHTATLGLGWIKEKNQIVSEGGVTVGSSMSGDRDKKSSTVRYAAINANIGYDVIKSDRVLLYPLVGLGGQAYQAIFYKDNSAVRFDDVLQSPVVQNNIQSVRFNNMFFVYRLGVGFAIKSPKNLGSAIGLQAGYTGSFKSRSWRSNEGQMLANSPEDKISQYFVSLVFSCKPMFMHKGM